jgi:penicillin amidase
VRMNYALSMRFAGLAPGPSAASGFGSASARNGKELVEAYRTFTTTPLNLVWGDDSGNIGWKIVGAIPNRTGFDGKYPTPGFTGNYEWNGMIPFDNLPHSENPPTHFIVTANNRLADVSWNGSWVAPWRYDRISDLIRAHNNKMTPDDFKSIQRDRVSLYARKLRDALVQAGDGGDNDVRWALGEIRGWDGAMTANSRPAAIVAAAEVALARRVFKPLLGDDDNYKSFMLLEDGGAYPASEDIIVRPGSSLWPGGADSESATLRASVKDALAILATRLGNDRDKWRWGALETIEFAHPLGARGGILGWYFNRGPFPTEGGRLTVNNSWFDLGDDSDQFKVTQISSYRFIADLGDPEGALAMNHSGESDHPASRHYDDMIGPWSRGEYHALDPSYTRAQSSAEAELDLVPR